MITTSRSSPWTFSSDFTKNGSPGWAAKKASVSGARRRSASSSSVTALRCANEKVAHAQRPARASRACRITAAATTPASTRLRLVPPGIEDPTLHVVEREPIPASTCIGARHDVEAVAVELAVGDGDERLVAAAVVPAQHALRQAPGREEAEDALDVGDLRAVLVLVLDAGLGRTRGA